MIDAHNHLDFPELAADRTALVDAARARGVDGWVLSGTHPTTWSRTHEVAQATGGLAVLGVHPAWAGRVKDWSTITHALAADAPIGIGEIGLDRRAADDDRAFAWQLQGFRTQLALARDANRPVVLHCVGAYPELLATMRRDGVPAAGGMVHGWSGPPDRIDEALALGLFVSFGPAVTRAHAPRQAASARNVPLDRLLIETDCPDQAPRDPSGASRRGTPADLVHVAAAVADLHEVSLTAVAESTHANTLRLFGLRRWP